MDYEVYLQGSYKNDTNVRGDSDVDVVVQLNSTFQLITGTLPQAEATAADRAFPVVAGYQWGDFDADVQTALRAHFGSARVQPHNKCVTVRGGSGTLDADVVITTQARDYTRFLNPSNSMFVEGVAFWTRTDGQRRRVINYPKAHYSNGAVKNFFSGRRYKPTVRMFKNARNYMIDHGMLGEGIAPSYFVECLLYNVPFDRFVASYAQTYRNVVVWLREASVFWICQNGIVPLFGDTPEQWNYADAWTYVEGLTRLWDEWR